MSKLTPSFSAHIINGKLKIIGHVRQGLNMWIESFKTGTQVDIIIKKHVDKNTQKQRGYYFGVVVVILADYFGYEKEEMHEELKLKFNPVKSKLSSDTIMGGSTTELLKDEYFGDEQSYVERIRRWAVVEYNVNIPDPERIAP